MRNRVHDIMDMRPFYEKTACIIAICIVFFIVILICISFLIVYSTSKADNLSLSGDSIPTIKYVVGDRKVSNVSKTVQDGIVYNEYTYVKVENVVEDILKYINYLATSEGFLTTMDYDLTKPTGTVQLGKKSIDDGKIILITIDYSLETYTITMTKGIGTITEK